MKTYDIKKIMVGLCIDESQSPGIRIDIVMDGIPEKLQRQMELEIKELEKKAMDIVTAASETTSSKTLNGINNR